MPRWGLVWCRMTSEAMGELEQSNSDEIVTAATSSASSPRRKRVLLVEEDPLARAFLLNRLRTEGMEVDVAWNGDLALQKLPGGQLDAIFLDLKHGEAHGVELIKAARRDPEFHDRPIYVCTNALPTSAAVRQAIKAGATKVFNRASNPVELIVASNFERSRAHTHRVHQENSRQTAGEPCVALHPPEVAGQMRGGKGPHRKMPGTLEQGAFGGNFCDDGHDAEHGTGSPGAAGISQGAV